jgi:3'-phosphoadenosine 5'-phosphosulfate sulfotransferase (PAPS reductase)/FAD synthetase
MSRAILRCAGIGCGGDVGIEHILSLSYGKDSLACLGAIEQLGWPLDRIVHAEVWATDTIPADLPPMVEFKAMADEIIYRRYGIRVERRSASVTYQEQFYRLRKSEIAGEQIYGFPIVKGAWCNSKLKMAAMPKASDDCVSYVGIAADEPARHKILSDRKRSPLVEAGWTEAMCREWCEKNDLLSPIYTTAARGGCWFCHNQGVDQLRLLRRNYPEYWALMLKWDADSPVSFKPDGHTVHDYDRRFRLEDEGAIDPNDNRFRWSWLDNGVQLKINI